MAQISKIIVSYLAGLIDGEGYIGILKEKRGNKAHWKGSKDYRYIPVMKVSSTNKEIIQWLKRLLGGTTYVENNKKWQKDSYIWMVRKSLVKKILQYISPYLRIKKRHTEIIFQFNKKNKKDRPLTEEEWKNRDRLYEMMRKLNKRGIVAQK